MHGAMRLIKMHGIDTDSKYQNEQYLQLPSKLKSLDNDGKTTLKTSLGPRESQLFFYLWYSLPLQI